MEKETYKMLLSYCVGITKNKQDAEDLCQETILKFLSSSYKDEGKILRFLYTIARNLFISSKRKKILKEIPFATTTHNDGYYGLVEKDIFNRLDKLPPIRNKIIRLQIEGYSCSEISEMLSLPANTVRSHIHLIRKTLKK